MKLTSLTHPPIPPKARVRFASNINPDDLNLNSLTPPPEPFFNSLHYPFLKTAVTRFDNLNELDLPAVKAIVTRIQDDPALSQPHHKQLGKLLGTAIEQLEKTGMFRPWTHKNWEYRRERAAQAGKTIAKLAELPSPGKAGYAELANLWVLALISNPRHEMAMFTGLWGAMSLPLGHKRDLAITLGTQNENRDVRRLASHGVSAMQDKTLKEAVLYRMSNDSDALIRLRSDILKRPRSPINWLLGWVVLRKPSY